MTFPPKCPVSHLLLCHWQGGSYGRKTVLRGNSDGTLVVFISDLGQFQDLKRKSQHEFLNKICEWLKASRLERKLVAKMEIKRPYGGLTIQLSTKSQSITFDVLPTFDAVGEPSWVCGGEYGYAGVC